MAEKISVYDIGYEVSKALGFKTPDQKRNVITVIQACLADKWPAEPLLEYLRSHDYQPPRYQFKGDQNLLDPYRFYYHSALMIVPPPPTNNFDFESGEITRKEEPYYLEMMASFNLEDLYEYLMTKQSLYDKNFVQKNKILGTLRYVLKVVGDIELLLFTIDEAEKTVSASSVSFIETIAITNHIKDGKASRDAKLTESREMSCDKVYPRKRMPLV